MINIWFKTVKEAIKGLDRIAIEEQRLIAKKEIIDKYSNGLVYGQCDDGIGFFDPESYIDDGDIIDETDYSQFDCDPDPDFDPNNVTIALRRCFDRAMFTLTVDENECDSIMSRITYNKEYIYNGTRYEIVFVGVKSLN